MGCCQSSESAIVDGYRRGAASGKDELPKPKVDSNLTDADRERIRKERAEAAEARLKKNQIGGTTKKNNRYKTDDIRGPNTKNTMSWQIG